MVALPYQLTKTLLCAINEIQGISGVDPQYLTNTTLNYKHGVSPDDIPSEPPKIAYFGIGINGFKNLNDQNLAAPFIPSAADMDLYEPIPFRVVPIDNDITVTERSNYRIRVLKTIGGAQYWCYYLKKLDIIDNKVKIMETDLTDGSEIELTTLDPNNLTPTPMNTSAEGVSESSKEISVALTANMTITGEEVVEAINVLYSGNLLKAKISEVGIYSGLDKSIVGSDGIGGTFNYTESILTQLCYHYTNLGNDFSDPSRIETIRLRINSASAFLL